MSCFLNGIQPQLLQGSAVLSCLKPPEVIVDDRHLLLKIRVLLNRMFPECGEKEKWRLIKLNCRHPPQMHHVTSGCRRVADKFICTLFESSVKNLLYTLAIKSWKRRGPHFEKTSGRAWVNAFSTTCIRASGTQNCFNLTTPGPVQGFLQPRISSRVFDSLEKHGPRHVSPLSIKMFE
ncbi:hypothetical protein CEXT_300911 [Caerostris extrusa]|uniref:Uncharacterized protein n=1 Tax=Caerostris extrusa TaxID=172846 RepID=A0AAV4MSC8_CAEEX|nr:hypothetical protein CEXT_300911 [Caerostris extrusa]